MAQLEPEQRPQKRAHSLNVYFSTMGATRLAQMGYKFKLGGYLSNKNQNPKRWRKFAHNKKILWGEEAV